MFLPTPPQSVIARYRRHLVATVATSSAFMLLASAAPANATDKVKVSITSPKAGTTISGAQQFIAVVKLPGAAKVDSVAFYVDGAFVGRDRKSPYSSKNGGLINTTAGENGVHIFKTVTAVKGKRAKLTKSAAVTVNNPVAMRVPQSEPLDPARTASKPSTTARKPRPVEPGPTPTPTPIPTPVPSAVPDPAPAFAPPGGGTWKLKFRDEFNGAALDGSKWSAQRDDWLKGGVQYNNLESAWYMPGNASVANGNLGLTVKKEASNGFPYTTGSINTHHKFSFTYGYVEARIKVPSCSGCWPAFWMLPSSDTWPPEIDIFEFFDTSTVKWPYFSYHWNQNGAHEYKNFGYGDPSNPNYTEAWHTYSLLWSPTTIQAFVDGRPSTAYSDSSRIVGQPMYLILQLAVGAGYSPADGSQMQTDYMRAWQLG